LIAAVLFIFSDQIATAIFKTGAAVLPLRILCAWFFVEVFYRVLVCTFQGLQNMLVLALMRFFLDMFILLMAVLFIGVIGWGVGGVAFAYLAATLAVVVSGLAYFRWRYPQVFKGKVSITKPLTKKLFSFALPIFIASLGFIVLEYIDTLAIAAFRTLPEVGFYQAAQPIARLLWYFSGALSTVLLPMISEIWTKRERGALNSIMHFLTKFSFMLIIPAALVFIAFPDIVIRLIFGEGYLAGATALQILSVAAIVYTLFVILSVAIVGIGKSIVSVKAVGAMACLNLVGNLLLIPTYGIEGAAVAHFASYTLGFLLLLYYVRKFVKFTVPALSLLKTVIGGTLTLLLILGLKSILVLPPWPEAFVVMIPGLLFYGVWILATKAITRNDLRLIARIVPMPGWLVRLASRFVKK
jgi:stage V sporulation protein B